MAIYTEYFWDYYRRTGFIPKCLELMPDDDNGFTFIDRFETRNWYKELGSETEELFQMHFQRVASECVNKYKWKIDTYLANRDQLLSRLIDMTEEETSTESGENTSHAETVIAGKESYIDASNEKTDNSKEASGAKSQTGSDVIQKDIKTDNEETTSGESTEKDSTSDIEHLEAVQLGFFNPIDTNSDNIINKTTNENNKTDTASTNKEISSSSLKSDVYTEDNKATTTYGNRISTTDNETIQGTTAVEETGNKENEGSETGDNSAKHTNEKYIARKFNRAFGYFATNPQIMKATLEIENIYEEALAYMDKLFMGVL